MSRAHRRRILERVEAWKLAREAEIERRRLDLFEALGISDDSYSPDGGIDHCSICSAELDGCGNFMECEICRMPGCEACLHSGDDMYPYLCAECFGSDDAELEDVDLSSLPKA